MPTRPALPRWLLAAALALLALSCKRCEKQPAAPPPEAAELLPRQVELALEVPDLSRLGGHAHQLAALKLANRAAQAAGWGEANGFFAELSRQLGFDPTTPAGLAQAGLAPNAALLLVEQPDGSGLAVLDVADPSKFDAALGKLARERLGAPERSEAEGIVRFAAKGQPPVAAYLRQGSRVAFSAGPGALAAVQAAKGRTKEQSLAAEPGFAALHGSAQGADLSLYIPATAKAAAQAGLGQGLSAALTVTAHALELAADLPLSTAQSTLFSSGQPGAGQDLAAKLDADAFFVARTGLDPSVLWPVAEAFVPAEYRQQLLNAGIRAGDVLANLQPGAAVALTLPPTVDLSRPPSLDPRESNPFRYVFLGALGRSRDAARSKTTLEGVKKAGKDLGAEVEAHEVAGAPAYTFKYALGEGASIALPGDAVAISGGEGRLQPLLERLKAPGGAGPALPAPVKERFGKARSAAYLDVDRVVTWLRALPASAYGLGGFAIRGAVLGWAEAVGEVHSLLVTADYKPNGGAGALRVELALALP